jgi:hypothetical protein
MFFPLESFVSFVVKFLSNEQGSHSKDTIDLFLWVAGCIMLKLTPEVERALSLGQLYFQPYLPRTVILRSGATLYWPPCALRPRTKGTGQCEESRCVQTGSRFFAPSGRSE